MNYVVVINRNSPGAGGQLGFDWGGIIAAAIPTAVSTLSGLFAGGGASGGQAKGLRAINAAGAQVIQALQQIAAQIRAGLPADQLSAAIAQAEQIAAALGNEQYFYQPRRGDDKAALDNFKAQAASILADIRSIVVPSPSSQTAIATAGPGTGSQPVTASIPATEDTIAGIPMTYIMLGGVGIVAYLLLK